MHQDLLKRISERADASLQAGCAQERRGTSGIFSMVAAKASSVAIDAGPVARRAGQYSFHDATRLRERCRKLIKEADGVVAEVTIFTPDLAMKLEMAITEKKPILCLFRSVLLAVDHHFPDLLTGAPTVTLKPYLDETDAGVDHLLDEFFARIIPAKRSRPPKSSAR